MPSSRSATHQAGHGSNRNAASTAKTGTSSALELRSPDGRWLAYTSDEAGLNELYVRPFPGPEEIAAFEWRCSLSGLV